jgi:flagellar motility protein MotE (MotC chaperone)
VNFRPRLIPSVILAATILLGLKVSDIFAVGSHARAEATSPAQATGAPMDLTSLANSTKMPSITPAAGSADNDNSAKPATPNAPQQQAAASQQQQAAAQKAPAQPQASTPASNNAKPTQTAEAPATDKAGAGQASAEKAGTDNAGADKAAADKSAGDKAPGRPPMKDPLLLSPAEIEVLQQLSARRTQIDQRASELDQQQVVLQATEKRIDEKIAKLETLQKSIQVSVDKENAADDARTQSLVKIYETMKPSDAAQILSQMDMPILLQMLSHMKEAKTAPILAAMDPAKAEAITTAMARRQNPPSAAPAPAAKP